MAKRDGRTDGTSAGRGIAHAMNATIAATPASVASTARATTLKAWCRTRDHLGGRRRDRLVNRNPYTSRRLESPLTILGQAPSQQLSKQVRRAGRQQGLGRVAFENRGQCVSDRIGGEGRAAGEHFEEHAAERPDVCPAVDRLAPRLLRAHVGRRAEHGPLVDARSGQVRRYREVGMRGAFPHFRQPEVEHLDHAVASDLDIRRLDVAMNNPLLVRGFEGFSDLTRDGHRLVDRQRSTCDPVRERRPVDQFQHERLPAAQRCPCRPSTLVGALFDAVDGGDVGVIECREHLGFACESCQPLRIECESFGQYLQRDIASEFRVAARYTSPIPPAPRRLTIRTADADTWSEDRVSRGVVRRRQLDSETNRQVRTHGPRADD